MRFQLLFFFPLALFLVGTTLVLSFPATAAPLRNAITESGPINLNDIICTTTQTSPYPSTIGNLLSLVYSQAEKGRLCAAVDIVPGPIQPPDIPCASHIDPADKNPDAQIGLLITNPAPGAGYRMEKVWDAAKDIYNNCQANITFDRYFPKEHVVYVWNETLVAGYKLVEISQKTYGFVYVRGLNDPRPWQMNAKGSGKNEWGSLAFNRICNLWFAKKPDDPAGINDGPKKNPRPTMKLPKGDQPRGDNTRPNPPKGDDNQGNPPKKDNTKPNRPKQIQAKPPKPHIHRRYTDEGRSLPRGGIWISAAHYINEELMGEDEKVEL